MEWLKHGTKVEWMKLLKSWLEQELLV